MKGLHKRKSQVSLAHLECCNQGCQTSDDGQDSEDKGQGKWGTQGMCKEEHTEDDAQDSQDSCTPACTLERLDQTDDTDHIA